MLGVFNINNQYCGKIFFLFRRQLCKKASMFSNGRTEAGTELGNILALVRILLNSIV